MQHLRTTTIHDSTTDVGDSLPPPPAGGYCLTVLFHPEPATIGAQYRWEITPGGEVLLTRASPEFHPPEGGTPGPLGDSRISRSSLRLVNTAKGLDLIPENDRVRFEVNGRPGLGLESVALSELARGVIITLGRQVSLMLHSVTRREDGPVLAGLLGVSDAIQRVRTEVSRVAGLELPVLLTGESGVGKELVAQGIHRLSRRASGKFVAVNLSALTTSTAAAELFGHARGAFTGAVARRPGYFGEAEGGTLFLDEIGETPAEIQPMLLRAIEAGEIQPLGLPARAAHVRILTATDSDLERLAASGRFRQALLHRLRATTITIPPLRDRRLDIPYLLVHFLRQALTQFGAEARLSPAPDGSPGWLRSREVLALMRYGWPGNVRELKNVAYELALASYTLPTATLPDWLWERIGEQEGLAAQPPERAPTLAVEPERSTTSPDASQAPRAVRPADIDEERLRAALEAHGWGIHATAHALGISRNSLYNLMNEAGIGHAGTLSREDILAAAQAVDSRDPAKVATRLNVSERGLTLRLRALGLTL